MDYSPSHVDLLLSRLFHDLISPVGAARNGLELLTEFRGDDVGADAMELAADSTEQATARLTFFRMAFGGAGSSPGHGFGECDRVSRAYLDSRRIGWSLTGGSGVTPQTGAIKVIMGVVAVLADSLPRLGKVSAVVEAGRATLTGDGDGAAFEPSVRAALVGRGGAADERSVLAATAFTNARRFDIALSIVDQAPPTVTVGFAEAS